MISSSGSPQQGRPLRVAVVAVHGVGGPAPDATAKNVAELLMQRPPAGVEYTWAEERRITIPTDKIDTGDRDDASFAKRLKRAFTSEAGDRTNLGVTDDPHSTRDFERNAEAALRPDIAFSRKCLRGYTSSHEPYSTVEMIGDRVVGGQATARVHVFEMYWADLTSEGGGLTRTFRTLYQLIQHISHIGRKTLDVAAQVAKARHALMADARTRARQAAEAGVDHDQLRALHARVDATSAAAASIGPPRAWSLYAWMHSWVIRMFTVLVPVASMLMLTSMLLFVPAAVHSSWHMAVGMTLTAALFTVLGGLAIYLGVDRHRAASYFVVYMLAVIALAIWIGSSASDDSPEGTRLLSVVALLISVAGYIGAVTRYNKTRSGALSFGVMGLLLVAIATSASNEQLTTGLQLDDAETLRTFGFIGFQWSYTLLMATWGLLWFVVLVSVGCRSYLWLRLRGKARHHLERSVWTARVTLASSIFFFILSLLVGYRSLTYVAARATGEVNLFPSPGESGELPVVDLRALPTDFTCFDRIGSVCSEGFFIELIARGGTSGFVLAAIGVALVLALASWFIVLIIVTAMKKEGTWGNDGEGRAAHATESRRLGSWMTNGFVWLRRAGSVLAWTLLVAIIVGIAIDYVPGAGTWMRARVWSWLAERLSLAWTAQVLDNLTLAVLASAASFGALRLRIQTLARRARPAMGVVLDVDNYLRESPHEGTPRAKIAERYASLLRYLKRHRDFDRIVLVSHSQGTVITTDLLRFLNLGVEPGTQDHGLISQGQFRLLTMGSPLRQLYATNFPHLYGWVTEHDRPPAERPELPMQAVPDISESSPDPAFLRVEQWVNLYTSGDYIGRYLWVDERWDGVWEPRDDAIEAAGRRERCLGAGTHTRYWDSKDVAEEVDRLIVAPAVPTYQVPPIDDVRARWA